MAAFLLSVSAHEQNQQSSDETKDGGTFRQSAAQQQSAVDLTRGLRLAGDGLAGLAGGNSDTDPGAYLQSLEKVAEFPAKRILPAHHSLVIEPEILIRMRNSFRRLKAEGKLLVNLHIDF